MELKAQRNPIHGSVLQHPLTRIDAMSIHVPSLKMVPEVSIVMKNNPRGGRR